MKIIKDKYYFMRKAKILIRFDDISSSMNWDIWLKLEHILYSNNIKPIIAVIPKNEDVKLLKFEQKSETYFWNKIIEYQNNGFKVAIHGYNHKYTKSNSGILLYNKNSEFAGVSYQIQEEKLRKSKKIFKKHGIDTDLFIAPSHSFDFNTLNCLKRNGIKYISDGFFDRIIQFKKLIFIPQMHWGFNNLKGQISTICLHPNNWTSEDLILFEKNIIEHKSDIIDFSEIHKIKPTYLKFRDLYIFIMFILKRTFKNILK